MFWISVVTSSESQAMGKLRSGVVCITSQSSILPAHFQAGCLSCSTRSTRVEASASLCINDSITKNLDFVLVCRWDSLLSAAREPQAGTHFLM